MSKENQEQLIAIEAPVHNPVIVKASAGTGKTRVLTERILFLIEKQGIKAENILAITYTNLAAEEMKKRVHDALNDSFKTPTAIGTIHSLFAEILRRDIDKIEGDQRDYSFDILYEKEQIRVINDAARNIGVSGVSEKNARQVFGDLSKWKTGRFLNEEILDPMVADKYGPLFEEYDKLLKGKNKLDFDDILILSNLLLKRYPEIREHWRNKYKCVLVDECQDLSEVQWQLIKQLLKPDGYGFFAVGDPNQCIYIFAGAKENIFDEIRELFKNSKLEEVDLIVNYRSFKSIVDNSNTLKVIKTKSSVSYSQEEGIVRECKNLTEAIKAIEQSGNYGSWAILFRKTSQAKPAIEELINLNIPFKVSKFYLFEDEKIEHIINFLKIVYFDNAFPLHQLIKRADLSLSEDGKNNLGNWALVPVGTSLLDLLISDVEEAINIFHLSKNDAAALRFLSRELIELKKFPENDVEKIIKRITLYLFSSKSLKGSAEKKVALFTKWLANTIKTTQKPAYEVILDLDGFAEFEKEEITNHKNNYVTLSTIHKTKGLEWDNVVVLEWETLLHEAAGDEKHIPYVATTRAKKQLFLIKK